MGGLAGITVASAGFASGLMGSAAIAEGQNYCLRKIYDTDDIITTIINDPSLMNRDYSKND